MQAYAHQHARAPQNPGPAPSRPPPGLHAILRAARIQPKLHIGAVDDPAEAEADRIADQVMRMPDSTLNDPAPPPANSNLRCKEASSTSIVAGDGASFSGGELSPSAESIIGNLGPGVPLPDSERAFFEPRFGRTLQHIRVHDGPMAHSATRTINARAFAFGKSIAFEQGQFNPGRSDGRKLIAHELAHISGGAWKSTNLVRRYTRDEQQAMIDGTLQPSDIDRQMANQRGFLPGDIVFRKGSTSLAFITGLPVTHGGIYIGNGLIHDAVGFGNRFVPVSYFYDPARKEAADRNMYARARFRGPQAAAILARMLANINSRNFRMPTGRIPFNLFSTANNYETATCLEFAHAQYLHAIQQLTTDPSMPTLVRNEIRTTYYKPNSANPANLANPEVQTLTGAPPSMSSSPTTTGGSFAGQGVSALFAQAALILAASAMASDVDPSRFANVAESSYRVVWPGGNGFSGALQDLLSGPLYDEVRLPTFTYQSFVNSNQFFETVMGT